MKLLFDENLSDRLVQRLEPDFPSSSHVRLQAQCGPSDLAVWQFARDNGFSIVTKDSDFDNLAVLFGKPPKVISVRLGNCTTVAVEILLRSSVDRIREFEADEEAGLLILP